MKISKIEEKERIKTLYQEALQMLREGTDTVGIKKMIEAFKKMKLPLPVPIVLAPKMILIDPIEIAKRSASGIVAPDGKNVKANWDLYYQHPNQGIVVAISEDIEWKGIYLGAKVFMHGSDQRGVPVYKYDGKDYAIVTYSAIIGVE